MAQTKTSLTHPIRVDWLTVDGIDPPWAGRVGLTFAPGKKDAQAMGGAWDRDLCLDLAHLRDGHGVSHIVCLLEDHEFRLLQIEDYEAQVEAHRFGLTRLPIRDVDVPSDIAEVESVVADILGLAQRGAAVVIHCRGGLGRAGTIGGCVLRAAGVDPDVAMQSLNDARGPNCPETNRQREFIRAFRPGV